MYPMRPPHTVLEIDMQALLLLPHYTPCGAVDGKLLPGILAGGASVDHGQVTAACQYSLRIDTFILVD